MMMYHWVSLVGLRMELVLDVEECRVEIVKALGVTIFFLRGHRHAVVPEADPIAEQTQVDCMLHPLQTLQLEDLLAGI